MVETVLKNASVKITLRAIIPMDIVFANQVLSWKLIYHGVTSMRQSQFPVYRAVIY